MLAEKICILEPLAEEILSAACWRAGEKGVYLDRLGVGQHTRVVADCGLG